MEISYGACVHYCSEASAHLASSVSADAAGSSFDWMGIETLSPLLLRDFSTRL
jgi:hypothetical protein